MLRDTMRLALDLGLDEDTRNNRDGTTGTEHTGQEACGNFIHDTFSMNDYAHAFSSTHFAFAFSASRTVFLLASSKMHIKSSFCEATLRFADVDICVFRGLVR